MPRLIGIAFAVVLVAAVVAITIVLSGDDPTPLDGLPDEAQAAKLFALKNPDLGFGHDRTYRSRAPFDCRRTEGDASLSGLIADIDFVCTPTKQDGTACGIGECAGFVVDFAGMRVKDYSQFGGP